MEYVPQDPMILLSFLNMKLRNEYDSLTELCESLGLDREDILRRMDAIGMTYLEEENRFF